MSQAVEKPTKLALELSVGESVAINHGEITVSLEHKSGHKARLVFTANQNVRFELQRNAANKA